MKFPFKDKRIREKVKGKNIMEACPREVNAKGVTSRGRAIRCKSAPGSPGCGLFAAIPHATKIRVSGEIRGCLQQHKLIKITMEKLNVARQIFRVLFSRYFPGIEKNTPHTLNSQLKNQSDCSRQISLASLLVQLYL